MKLIVGGLIAIAVAAVAAVASTTPEHVIVEQVSCQSSQSNDC